VSVGVLRTRLRNGLEVRLKEIHTAPLISAWVWYRVGSRNERPGTTGISHLVEHMQFKGTPHFPAGVLDKAIARRVLERHDRSTDGVIETMPAGGITAGLRPGPTAWSSLFANKFIRTHGDHLRTAGQRERAHLPIGRRGAGNRLPRPPVPPRGHRPHGRPGDDDAG
jgi:hypothetical protein